MTCSLPVSLLNACQQGRPQQAVALQSTNRCHAVHAEDPGEEPSDCVGALRLDAVTFSYPARPGVVVLRDLTLDVPAGEAGRASAALQSLKGSHV